MARIGALLFRVGDDARFLPASLALRVAPTPPITRAPGSPPELLGVALYEGAVVPVLSVGSSRREMVVCSVDGELVALVGGEAFEAGVFETDGESAEVLRHGGHRFAAIDVSALRASVGRDARRGP